MNCNDSRKYFYAFLDDELDVEKNIEVLAHLDMCCECGQRMEKERLLQRRVKETVCNVKVPDYLMENILTGTQERPKPFILFVKNSIFGRHLIPIAGIAAAIILIVGFYMIPGNLNKNDVIYQAESKYHEYMKQQLDLDIRSQDSGKIVEYLRKQTNSNVVLPEIKQDVQLIGATLSEVDGIKVSQVFYMYDEKPVSVTILCNPESQSEFGKEIDFSEMQKMSIDKKDIYFDDKGYCGRCRIMGWKELGNQYVVVSMLNSDDMIKMFKKA
ncbi:MAG: hypothetical protein GY941_23365 [Planctomycetes bacterium]|nr:hypothetical protein [Planctomycetota bacterium]